MNPLLLCTYRENTRLQEIIRQHENSIRDFEEKILDLDILGRYAKSLSKTICELLSHGLVFKHIRILTIFCLVIVCFLRCMQAPQFQLSVSS